MRTLLAAVSVFAVVMVCAVTGRAQGPAAGAVEPVGDAAAGKRHFTFGNTSCSNCHGAEGQGAFGPPLAGGHINFERFRGYVRKPFGRMPAYPESELTDQEIADMVAHFKTIPAGAKPAPWRTPQPEGAPRGQQLIISTIGCAQCHGATITTPRHGASEVTADFEWFKRQVYEHTTAMREQWQQLDKSLQPVTPQPSGPQGRNRIRMGNYTQTQVSEATLKEIWDWMNNDLGLYLAVLRGRITAGDASPAGATYTVEVTNTGVKGKGITNEDISVVVALPPGTKVVNAGGPGYEGVRADAEAKADVAAWRIPKLEAGARQAFTLTLSAAAPNLRGSIRWAKPAVKSDGTINFALAAGGRGGRGGEL